MEIIERKLIKKFLLIICLASLIIIGIPLSLYFSQFSFGFSKKQEDWASFGGFIGGSIGTLFNLLAIVFTLISIYITLKITTYLQKKEQEYTSENINREIERFKTETSLLQKQFKPYPAFTFLSLFDRTEIILSNHGPGTLIVKSWHLKVEDRTYTHFVDFIRGELLGGTKRSIAVRTEQGQNIILSTGSEKQLLVFTPQEGETNFKEFNTMCKDVLLKTRIVIIYEDILENSYELDHLLGS